MGKHRKELHQLRAEILERNHPKTDADGNVLIPIHISDDSNFLSIFSTDSSPVISSETAEFLEHRLKHLRADTKLHFLFTGSTIDDQERILYDAAIRSYYHAEFIESFQDLRKNSRLTALMVAVAALLFALAVTLDALGAKLVILNMLDVVAWVFMWEAVDIFVFQRSAFKRRRMRALRIIKSVISFS